MLQRIIQSIFSRNLLGIASLVFLAFISLMYADGGVKNTSDGGSGGGDGGGGGGGTQPANQLEIDPANATVPPGGVFQIQLSLTEPRPLGKGSSGLLASSANLGTAMGAAINSPSGEACGVALATSGGYQLSVVSPDGTLGTTTTTTTNYPIIVLSLPVKTSATVGSTTSVGLNINGAVYLDPLGNPYPLEFKSRTLTIGGSVSISNVLPGGGSVAAGSTISILGMGFSPTSLVQVSGANVVTTNFVSSSQLNITLDRAVTLDGASVQVTSNGQTVTYFSYLRAADSGPSSQPLLAAADPLFSLLTYTKASLPWTSSATTFTGLALQNGSSSAVSVTLQLLSSTNQVLKTVGVSLASQTKMTRDLAEFFGPPPAGASTVTIQSTGPIQLLGIQGDTSAGTLTPVVVTAQ